MISESKGKAEILVKQFQSVFTKDQPGPLPSVKKTTKNIINPIKIRTEGLQKTFVQSQSIKGLWTGQYTKQDTKGVRRTTGTRPLSYISTIDRLRWTTKGLEGCKYILYIQKRAIKHLAENYRPVSLTSVTSKLLCRHLLKHLQKNKILTTLNHGFRSGYSCETQLLTTMNDLLQSYDKGQQTDVAILWLLKGLRYCPSFKITSQAWALRHPREHIIRATGLPDN